MRDWKSIGSVSDVRRGASPRPISDPKYFGGGVGWVRIVDVTRSSRFLRETQQYLSALGEACSVRVDQGDLVMSICGTLGRPIMIDMPACIHDGFVQFCNLRGIGTEFLFYALQHSEPAFCAMGQPGTQTNLNTTLVGRHRIFCPNEGEQERIAEVLSTVDEAIEQTEALISKTQQIKAGLMHDLFTRGVTPNGKLRPPQNEAPQLYKESPIGWIPKEWDIETLAEVGRWMSGGTPSKAQPQFWGGAVPWVTPKDMKVFVLRSTQDRLTERGAATGSRIAPQGSVFIVVRGMILAHTFPVCLAICPMAFNQDVKAIVPRVGVRDAFLAYWFVANRDYMLGLVTEATHGTKRIDLRDLHRSYIAVAMDDEQDKIVDILQRLDVKIECDTAGVAKLRQQKSGLMHDLLNGRVRVTAAHDKRAAVKE